MKLREFLYTADNRTRFRIYTDPGHGTKEAHDATQLLIEVSNALLDREIAIYGLAPLEPPSTPSGKEIVIVYVLLKPEGK